MKNRYLEINPSWTYKQTVNNIQTLKIRYEEILASFLCYEYREKTNFIRISKQQFYSLNMLEWQKDRLWNYLNGADSLIKLKQSAERYK